LSLISVLHLCFLPISRSRCACNVSLSRLISSAINQTFVSCSSGQWSIAAVVAAKGEEQSHRTRHKQAASIWKIKLNPMWQQHKKCKKSRKGEMAIKEKPENRPTPGRESPNRFHRTLDSVFPAFTTQLHHHPNQ